MVRPALAAAFLLMAGCSADTGLPTNDEPASKAELELTGRVVDEANILSAPFEARLSEQLGKLEDNTGVQLVVATTPDLKRHTIEDYSLDLANAWGIGSAERNDGMMLLVAPNERKARIEVGYGLEASVRDEEAGQILRDHILPRFRKGDYERGIEQGVDALIDEVTSGELKEAA